MIDPATFDRFQEAKATARDHGLSLVEVLDNRGLLWTPKRQHDLTVTTLDDLSRRLERQGANKLMSFVYGRVDGTSGEMLHAVKTWLEIVCRNAANGTLEEL